MPSGLLETIAALVVTGALLATLTAGLAANARLAAEAAAIEASVVRWRQVEHLLDVAVARSGAGPLRRRRAHPGANAGRPRRLQRRGCHFPIRL